MPSNKAWDSAPKDVPIQDIDAEHVDNAVRKLYRSDKNLGDCFVKKWVYRESEQRIAKEMHCSRTPVREHIAHAETAIQVIINDSKMTM